MKIGKLLRRFLPMASAGVMVFSLLAAGVPASAAKEKKAKEVDLNGTYHATLGIQTATDLWITRMAYYHKSQNDYYGTEDADKMFCKNKETQEMEAQPGEFKDVEIKGNGTYTVSLENAEFSGEQIISQLHIATDIPLNDTIKFSNVSLSVNNRTITEFEEGFMEDEEPYLQGGMVCLIFNHWRAELVKMLEEKGLPEDCSNGYTLLQGSGQEKVSVTFTVSGFAYDNQDAQEVSADSGAEAAQSAGEKADAGSNSSAPMVIVIVVLAAVLVVVVILIARRKRMS